MAYARVFKSGNSQAVRIPKDFQIKSDRVQIIKRSGDIILREQPRYLKEALASLPTLPDDCFTEERVDDAPQTRTPL